MLHRLKGQKIASYTHDSNYQQSKNTNYPLILHVNIYKFDFKRQRTPSAENPHIVFKIHNKNKFGIHCFIHLKSHDIKYEN